MNTIRFTITDRATGHKVTVGRPMNAAEDAKLRAGIRHLSKLGVRGGCLENYGS